MDAYQINFAALIGLCGALFLAQPKAKEAASETKGSKAGEKKTKKSADTTDASQWPFLVVFCLVMGSDWLQGPFLYSLYREEHGISASIVSTLFTTGFLSGAVSGYFVGTLADKHGRKAACLLFCAAYAASCLLTTIPSVPLLFAGRVLGGISTSMLFSVFDSWMVTDFQNRKLADKGGDLSRTFVLMSTLNSVTAIISGVFSEWIVAVTGTRKAPFVTSMLLLGVAAYFISSKWAENYGGSAKQEKKKDDKSEVIVDHTNKLSHILTDPKIIALGLASTMFEGSMYLFVFFWSPALNAAKTNDAGLPYGIIFASFMASGLAASLFFNVFMERGLLRYITLMIMILGAADVCFVSLSGAPRSEQSTFWIFCAFEACVGMYWPCMGLLKGKLISDGARAQVYSVLRIPLNLFVVISLMLTEGDAGYAQVFGACSKLLMFSCLGLGAMVMNEEHLP
ncbi:hypothetical protein MCOR12_009620 [Pyricularia oryzae]|nr:hypothetical protein MCOR12_009620 [Pyricularia oryzae]